MHIWLTLIEGGAGAMFWQYRPEYMTFEAPGLSIMALDGGPTERFAAAERTIARIDAISDHLPLSIPRSEMAIAYSGGSHQVYSFNDADYKFLQHHRGMYRALWPHSVAVDLVTAKTDWSGYRLGVPARLGGHGGGGPLPESGECSSRNRGRACSPTGISRPSPPRDTGASALRKGSATLSTAA